MNILNNNYPNTNTNSLLKIYNIKKYPANLSSFRICYVDMKENSSSKIKYRRSKINRLNSHNYFSKKISTTITSVTMLNKNPTISFSSSKLKKTLFSDYLGKEFNLVTHKSSKYKKESNINTELSSSLFLLKRSLQIKK